MNETGEVVGPPKRKDVLKEMFKTAAKERIVTHRQDTLDGSNAVLHSYARKLSLEADGHDRSGNKDQAEEVRQRAVEVMALVTGGEETVDKGKFREALLCQARDALVQELPNAMRRPYALLWSKDNDQRRKAWEDFTKAFNHLNPKDKEKYEVVVDELRRMNGLIHEVSVNVAEAEGKTEAPSLKEWFRSIMRLEVAVPVSMRTRFARWFSEKTGIDRELWRDPHKLTDVQREMVVRGANAFDLHRESVAGDIDAVVEKMKKEGKGEVVPNPDQQAAIEGAKKLFTEETSSGNMKVYDTADTYRDKIARIIQVGGTPEEIANKVRAVIPEIAKDIVPGNDTAQKLITDALTKGIEKKRAEDDPGADKKKWRVALIYLLLTLPEEILKEAVAASQAGLRPQQ